MTGGGATKRTFKTAWFAKAARNARITDDKLCEAIQEVMKGQADDFGGGVFKKRRNGNRHRSQGCSTLYTESDLQHVLAK